MQANDQILLAIVRPQQRQIGLREPGIQEPLAHGLRRRRHVTGRVGRIDLDQLFEEVAGERVDRRPDRLGPGSRRYRGRRKQATHEHGGAQRQGDQRAS